MKTTDHQSAVAGTWAPTPEEFIRLTNEATDAVRLSKAGEPLTPEQASLLEWINSPLPMLSRPSHLKA
jgi:hypothetical protein